MLPLVKSLRPRQWTKNLVVFAGLAFSGQAGEPEAILCTVLAFAGFCLISSALYLGNDLVDREADRLHPQKRHRPIAAGTLAPSHAFAAAFLLLAGGFAVAWNAGRAVEALGAYFLLQLLYNAALKRIVLLDVFAIAAGFSLRVLGGVWAVGVEPSPWLLACTMQLALFLALCKRRAEAASLDEGGELAQRATLVEYQGASTDAMVVVVAASTVITYTLYTLLPGEVLVGPEFAETSMAGRPGMVWTLPFVYYGVLRYLHLVYRHDRGQRPELIATTDLPILFTGLGYAAVVANVVYG